MRLLTLLSSIGLFIVLGCGKSLPELEDMNLTAWQEDKNGCQNKRASMSESIRSQKDKLLALTEHQVIELLGKPDQNELYSRNQKFYSYFLSPAPACDPQIASSKALIIRFNAMGLAKEVNIE